MIRALNRLLGRRPDTADARATALAPNRLQSTPLDPTDVDAARRTAWLIAIAADFLQIVAMPLFAGGVVSPANDLLDVIVCVFMIRLLGWHPAFLPSLVAELVPVLGLVPTWTAAVWLVTRGKPRAQRTAG
jgi:hypothetical protein